MPASNPGVGRAENVRSVACLSAAALAMGLAFPPGDLWWAAAAVPGLFAHGSVAARSTARAALTVFIVQTALWLWLLRWIIPVTGAGYPALAMYMAGHGVLAAWVLRRVLARRQRSTARTAVAVAMVWTAHEFFRGEVLFNGYPWYLVSHPMIASPALVQAADLGGAYFVSFLVAWVSGFGLCAAYRAHGATGRTVRAAAAPIGAAMLVVLAMLLYGTWRMTQAWALHPGPRVLAIQTNLPQDNKNAWTIAEQAVDVPGFLDQTRAAAAGVSPPPDLIVWPETMLPSLGFESDTMANIAAFGAQLSHLLRWPAEVMALSRALGAPMVVGTEAWVNTAIVPIAGDPARHRLEPGLTYNSAYLIQGDPPFQRYDKAVLTPFGETMPYISNWPWLERAMLSLGAPGMSFELDSNPDIALLTLSQRADARQEAVWRVATPICFEDTVAWLCRRMVYANGRKRGDVFVNISNDGWFGGSVADRRLHAQVARFRCIENRVPMVRCVNTGLSVSVDSHGRLMGAVGGVGYGVARQPGWLLADVVLDRRTTVYGRVGDMWGWLCLVGAVVAAAVAIFSARKSMRARSTSP